MEVLIFSWKLTFVSVFGKAWTKPNFEALDFFIPAVKKLGASRYFSAELYEPLHREMKKARN